MSPPLALNAPADASLASLRDHVVICNCNPKVGRIVEELHLAAGRRAVDVVLVVQDAELWAAHPEWHPVAGGRGRFHALESCPTDVAGLARAGIDRARAAIILADPVQGPLADARSALVAMAIEQRNPSVHTVMELLSSGQRVHVRAGEVDEVVCVGRITEKLLAQSCFTPRIKDLFLHLLTTAPTTNQLFVRPLPKALVGLSFRAIATGAIRSRAPFVVCGFRQEGPPPLFVVNPRSEVEPGRDTTLGPTDQLLVLAYSPPELGRWLPSGEPPA